MSNSPLTIKQYASRAVIVVGIAEEDHVGRSWTGYQRLDRPVDVVIAAHRG